MIVDYKSTNASTDQVLETQSGNSEKVLKSTFSTSTELLDPYLVWVPLKWFHNGGVNSLRKLKVVGKLLSWVVTICDVKF